MSAFRHPTFLECILLNLQEISLAGIVARRALTLMAWSLVVLFVGGNSVHADNTPTPIDLKVVGPVEGNLALYNTIKIRVENLAEWAKRPDNKPSALVLYIDGNAFRGLPASVVDNNTKLQFDLKRLPDNEDNRKAWNAVLSRRPKD
jgi:hypothetical protein